MEIFDLILGVLEFLTSWRLLLCPIVAIGVALVLHDSFPNQSWAWFLSIPTVLCGIILGFWWQRRADGASGK